MFDNLAGRFNDILTKVRGRGKITEKDIEEAGRGIRLALLEADVNYKVVKELVASIKDKALGEEVMKSLKPGHQVVAIVRDELAAIMGGDDKPLVLSGTRPDKILLAGLQGSGKTTAAAKLALMFKKDGKKSLLVAADTYRPAAQDQLASLGAEMDIEVYRGSPGDSPVKIARDAVKGAAGSVYDAVIIDTAGRLHIDEEMMAEIKEIKDTVNPGHILFVADSMIGQDAVNQAAAFNDSLDYEGVILTKLDGDARGGAALSIRQVTGKPIMFVSTGEKPKDFEVFHPERMASRILGMGDILTLVERAEQAVDKEEAEELAKKLMREDFTLADFLAQLEQLSKMGGLNDMIGMLPKSMVPKGAGDLSVDESQMARTKAIIRSMTEEERMKPKVINGSRRARIAAGSGTNVSDVNALLKQFEMMKKMVKSLKKKEVHKVWR